MFALKMFGFWFVVLAPIIFFRVSLTDYRATKRKYDQTHCPEHQKELSYRRVLLIVSSVILGALIVVAIISVILFRQYLAYM